MNEKQETKSDFLDSKQAAALLGVTPQMIRAAARAGLIKAYHPFSGCTKYIFKADELKAGIIPAEDL